MRASIQLPLWALCLALAGTLAQGAQEGSTLVRGLRSEDPATASRAFDITVSAEELAATGERSLPRALGRASGVWIQETNLGGGAPVIGGLLGNRIVIVVDGVRMNDSTTRSGPNQSLNSIPPQIVERIDVIRGPGSVLYGSDAVGGTILIWTRRRAPAFEDPAAGAPGGSLTGTYDSASEGGRAAITGSWAGAEDGFLASAGGQGWGDLRAGGGMEFPTAYDGADLFGSWVHALGPRREWRFTAQASQQYHVPRTDRLVTGFGQTQPSEELWDYSLQDRQRYLAVYSDATGGVLADRWDLRLSLRSYVEEREMRKLGAGTQTFERDETRTLGLGLDWKRSLGDEHLVSWGLDLEHDWVDAVGSQLDLGSGTSTSTDGAFAPDASYTSGGLFVQDEVFALEPWDLTAGLRWSWFHFGFDDFPSAATGGGESGSFHALTASLAGARDLAEGVRVTAQVGQGFRAPNLDDLASESSFFGGTELPNPALDPERSLTVQLALDVARPAWGASLGVFHTWLHDLIGRRLVSAGDPNQTGDETYMRDNAGTARLLGADLSARRRLGGEGSPFSTELGLSAAVGQQFDDTIDPATGTMPLQDVPFRRMPPLFGRVGLIWDGAHPRQRVDRAELVLSFAARQDRLNPEDIDDPRIDPSGTPGWGRLDVECEGPLGSGEARALARWRLGLLNLLDARYRVHGSGLDAPGRSLVVGLDVSI